MKATILLAEDERDMREVLYDYFTAKSGGELTMISAPDGNTALHLIETQPFDLLLLDIMLPGTDGFALCRAAREQGEAPILFITAREDEQDKLHGYGLGADDYVVKPFSLAVLYAKAQALLRRSRGMTATEVLIAGALVLDPARGTVTADGQRIDLPPKEFALLRVLMERRNRVLTRDELLNLAWGWDFDGSDRVVDSHIKKLRRALGTHADCIKTVVKRGYKLEVDGDENNT
ncbi:response regulator transcription factor [Agathobaculum sp.]|uniref:response regulator transcription factor n=1 Tax=Agathobaculum sp. TaxID=2048138 RepID=UPI003AB5674B